MKNEKISQAAHQLALQHDPMIKRISSNRLWRNSQADLGQLRAFAAQLRTKCGASCTQPAEEWLLDHSEFIEAEVITLKSDLSKHLLKALPCLSKTEELRIASICTNYLELTDGHLNEEAFTTYLNSYQEVSILTIAEAWAIPLIMRIALIRQLALVMEDVKESRAVCEMVERILSGIKPTELTPNTLKLALEEAGQDMPLSGSLIVHLVQHLRERARDKANVGEWLLCKLENGPDSLDAILSYDFQLQAARRVRTANLIGSLHKLSRWTWRDVFERICLVEVTLQGEQAGHYSLMDFSSRNQLRERVERLAHSLRVPENLVASHAVQLANAVYDREGSRESSSELLPRDSNAAYYLLESDGLSALKSSLAMCGETKKAVLPNSALLRKAKGAYFYTFGVCFAVAMLGFFIWVSWDMELSWLSGLFVLLALALPASEWATTAVHWLLERTKRPVRLLRYDFSQGVPQEAATMVVIPVIWSTAEEVEVLTERLELHYLANRDDHVHFALLSDFKDADSEQLSQDQAVLDAASARINELNQAYPGNKFHLFHRKRLWNASEEVWMGWERKRGKLVEFVELLKGHKDTSYEVVNGDEAVLGQIRYIITLDADTQLPLESARRMIGTLHLPYNRPRLNNGKTRVIEGYGVLQPRIGMTYEAAQRSRLSSLWAGNPGVDPYAFAVSDPYQDGFGQAIFTGKGIFEVDAFYSILCERIPDNRVLSHDLLEGGFLRAGLISDIELIDDHPSTYCAHQRRLHRWVRGDWQLLLWLLPKARNRRGQLLPVDLSVLTRWQILDNLRRSLVVPALMAIWLGIAAAVLPGYAERWFLLAAGTLLLPVLRQCWNPLAAFRSPRSVAATAGHALVVLITLPYQTILMLDAIIRTLHRLFISKRRLLQWVNQAEVDRMSAQSGAPMLLGMFSGYALIAAFLIALIWNWSGELVVQAGGLVLSALWLTAPVTIRWLDQPLQLEGPPLNAEEREELSVLAKQIWSYFDDYVTEGDHWLPPDNVQLEPPNGVAHRTSPTNIGLYLTCVLAARDFGFIDTSDMLERMERTVTTIEQMEKWNGHLFNWYDTETLAPLPPKYVSTVDSGNFVVCLITAKEGLQEYLRMETKQFTPAYGGGRQRGMYNEHEDQVAFAEEITPQHARRGKQEGGAKRIARLTARVETLIQGTDYRPLYDHKAELFSLGYYGDRHERDSALYDLIASETRLTSFAAIALGQVSVSHWSALGRTMTRTGRHPVLLSWTGTMFEYLMPWLFMRTYRHTIWDNTYKGVVKRQIEYARQRQVPFGISESGMYAFDYRMNYQYKAFGVPGLGFKRGLEHDLVIAPYATIMALPYAKREVLADLQAIEQLGGRGKYGFYEALDYTAGRVPEGRRHMVVESFMAHHQGMSMLTLSNVLLPQTIYGRFHNDKQVRAAELLLQERMPTKPALIQHPALYVEYEPHTRTEHNEDEARGDIAVRTSIPEVCVLSNGKFTTVVTNSGSGFSQYEGSDVSRWREDPVRDAWGSYIYIRDVTQDKVWSPSLQPCQAEASELRVMLELDRATFLRKDEAIYTRMEICVAPEWDAEIRRLSLTNSGDEAKVFEVTTFVELALANRIADVAHPAFSKLFIRTAFDAESDCLVAGRRPREAKGSLLWAAHSLIVLGASYGPVEFETDRSAFIGRGHTLSDPQAIRSRLLGKTGSVADPAFIMRRRIQLEPGEQVQLVAVTAAAPTQEEAVTIVSGYSEPMAVERAFELAWNRARVELRNLKLEYGEAAVFQRLAGQVIYTSPLREERKARILANSKGQSSLWAFGISGDRPVALARIDDRSQLPFITNVLTGHEYLRRLGLQFDLIILNESSEEHLHDSLQWAADYELDRFGAGSAGVYVLTASQLAEEDKTLLLATARLTLHAGGPSLEVQLQHQEDEAAWPQALVPVTPPPMQTETVPPASASASTTGYKDAYDPKGWLFFNGWGGFAPDGKAYHILIKNDKHLPAPWMNVLANPRFGSLITELGTGYTWWRNSRECKLTPWSNDPVLDPPAEKAYIRDEASGAVWSVTPSAVNAANAANSANAYKITHGRGFSRFEHDRYGIRHEMTVYVPLEDPVKIMRISLKNETSVPRKLSLTYYAEWVLGVQRQANAPYIVTEWNAEAGILTAINKYQETFRDATAFLSMASARTSASGAPDPEPSISWTGDRREFIGRNGSLEMPAALLRESLSGATGAQYESCGALQLKLALEPGEEREVVVLLGCESSVEAAARLARKYSETSAREQAMEDINDFWERTLDQIVISTPSPEMDVLLNGWLIYQSLACRMWGRTGFYQAGGAYGYRDQLQDSLSKLHVMPEITRAQIVLHASHQYEEGDVQHWWHEDTEWGIRTKFSDDLLWLPYAISRYIEHIGDWSILLEEAPFITSEPLSEEEHERYEPTRLSGETGTLYEHGMRAIDRSLQRIGQHGLPLIGVGDWNDGMNLVGAEGRGESVWLGWFLCDVLQRYAVLCDGQGDSERAFRYRNARESFTAAINEHAWDGQWYRRAMMDNGQWLGSIHNDECRIDAIAQSWSVISGAAPQERAMQAMQSFDRELVEREMSIIRLLTPAFDHTEPSPGYIQGYPPGIRENGAQYTHGVIWGIVAWAQLRNGDKAFEAFNMLNPINHTRTEQEVRTYVGEPYVMAADVYTADPHKGHAGWTWYTGAAGWMYQAGIEWVLGIRRRGNKLYIDPCIPADWPGYTISYRFGETRYSIEVRKRQGHEESAGLWLDERLIANAKGTESGLESQELLESSGGGCITLTDDRLEHRVVLVL